MRKAIFAIASTFIGTAVVVINAGAAQADSNSMLCVKGGGHIVVQKMYQPKGWKHVCQGGKYNGQVLSKHYTF
ncbi:hypothetical protein [Nocardia sp. NPDC003979]